MDSPRGFTLIEILVVVAILAILAALALPVIGNMTRKAGTAETISNLRQIYLLLGPYAEDHNGLWPVPKDGDLFWSKDALFPYINNGEPATNWSDLADTVFVSPNAPAIGKKDNAAAPTVSNPSNQGFGMNTHLPSPEDTAGNENYGGDKPPTVLKLNQLSSTMLLMDCNAPTIIGQSFFLNQFTTFVKNRHKERNTVLFCDGHVKLIEQARFDTSHENPLMPFNASFGTDASLFWRGR